MTCYHLEKHPVIRQSLSAAMPLHGLAPCAGGADNVHDFLAFIRFNRVDVLLLDMELEFGHWHNVQACLRFCARLRKIVPQLKIVLHSPFSHVQWVKPFLKLGINGVVSKNTGLSETIDVIAKLENGRTVLCPRTESQLRDTTIASEHKKNNSRCFPMFSPQERSVLAMIIEGLSTRNVAERLGIGLKTVETHRANLVKKARVKNTAQLISFVYSHELFL